MCTPRCPHKVQSPLGLILVQAARPRIGFFAIVDMRVFFETHSILKPCSLVCWLMPLRFLSRALRPAAPGRQIRNVRYCCGWRAILYPPSWFGGCGEAPGGWSLLPVGRGPTCRGRYSKRLYVLEINGFRAVRCQSVFLIPAKKLKSKSVGF